MTWMNEMEIADATDHWYSHPVLGPAVRTLNALVETTNQNSDGWHIWPKPARAASRLMDMLQDASWRPGDSRYREPSQARLVAALAPVKRFRTVMTRQHGDRWDFTVTERLPTRREELSAEITRAERTARDHDTFAAHWRSETRRLMSELADLPLETGDHDAS